MKIYIGTNRWSENIGCAPWHGSEADSAYGQRVQTFAICIALVYWYAHGRGELLNNCENTMGPVFREQIRVSAFPAEVTCSILLDEGEETTMQTVATFARNEDAESRVNADYPASDYGYVAVLAGAIVFCLLERESEREITFCCANREFKIKKGKLTWSRGGSDELIFDANPTCT